MRDNTLAVQREGLDKGYWVSLWTAPSADWSTLMRTNSIRDLLTHKPHRVQKNFVDNTKIQNGATILRELID